MTVGWSGPTTAGDRMYDSGFITRVADPDQIRSRLGHACTSPVLPSTTSGPHLALLAPLSSPLSNRPSPSLPHLSGTRTCTAVVRGAGVLHAS